MNIFKALSEGNGKISETNITSFLNYLLDSSNELNNSFFILFSNLIDQNLDNPILKTNLFLEARSLREQILSFSTMYTVQCEPEYSIKNNYGNKVIPDILLRVVHKQSEEDILYCIIENKINKSAISNGQIEKQFKFFIDSDDYKTGAPVISIYITPDEPVYQFLVDNSKTENPNTAWIKWVNHKENENSIEATLKTLIVEEQKAEIQPIDLNTKFIIKSFIDYISTEFRERINGKKNFSYKGFNVSSIAETTYKGDKLIIKRFSNNMIRFFDEEDNLREVEVKPILRDLNQELRLNIELTHSTGKAKNTQILGREIINKLNSINNQQNV